MQYMALIYSSPGSEPTYGTPEFKAMMDGYFAFTAFLKDKGAFVLVTASKAPKPPPRCACAAARSRPWTALLPKPRSIWAATT